MDHEVVIVGAGFSGIGAAISLQKAGIHDLDVPLRPVPTLETMWRSRRFQLEDYVFAA